VRLIKFGNPGFIRPSLKDQERVKSVIAQSQAEKIKQIEKRQ